MRICELISILTDLIERSELPKTTKQRDRIAHLREIAEYERRGKLVEWERRLTEAAESVVDATDALLDAVTDVATFNMYGRFEPQGALEVFAIAAAKFSEAGLAPPRVDFIEGW